MNVIRPPATDASPADQAAPDDVLLRFSRGELGRHEAMAALGDISYYELLDRMAEARLPLFSLPPEQIEAMANDFVALMASMDR